MPTLLIPGAAPPSKPMTPAHGTAPTHPPPCQGFDPDYFGGKNILITGATGLVGMLVFHQLLQRHFREIRSCILLIRPGANGTAPERLDREIFQEEIFQALFRDPIFARTCGAQGHDPSPSAVKEAIRGKIRAISGAFVQGKLEAPALESQDFDVVIHCAGSTEFSAPLDEAYATHTRFAVELLSFCDRLANSRGRSCDFAYVSTIYVCGRQTGIIEETLHPKRHTSREMRAAIEEAIAHSRPVEMSSAGHRLAVRFGFHNVYEMTKWLAEWEIVEAARNTRGRVRALLLRAGIVTGTAATGWYGPRKSRFKVIYPYLYYISMGYLRWIPGRPENPIPMVPGDITARYVLSALQHRGAEIPVLHLTGTRPTEVPRLGPLARHAGPLMTDALYRTVAEPHRQKFQQARFRFRPPRLIPRWLFRLTFDLDARRSHLPRELEIII
ncbi:MAG: SDR family oxidoreductase, partial [Acidobacteria bacterium]|nr:SDR family oxidoreductase [Acidobacteriota bacterium]